MLDQLPGDGRHAASQGDALALDQLERPHRVPLVHHHHLGADEEGRVQDGETAGGVEERHRQQRGALGPVRIGNRRRLAPAQEAARGDAADRRDIAVDVAVARQGALGLSRGARGVEDGGVVVLNDLDCRQGPIRQLDPVVGPAQDLFQAGDFGMGHLLVLAADIDRLQVRTVGQVLEDPTQALGVDHRHLGAGIDQAIFQLRPGPPGVQRGDDRAQRGGGVEGDRPFGQVAHDHRHPVAFHHAPGLKLMGEGGDGAVEGLETGPLVLIDQEDALPVSAAQLNHVPQRGRRVLPHPRGDAVDRHRLHLEGRAGGGQQRMGLSDRHGRPSRPGRGRVRDRLSGFGHALLQAMRRQRGALLSLSEQA